MARNDQDDAPADSDALDDAGRPRDSVFDDSDPGLPPEAGADDDTDAMSLGQSALRKFFDLGSTEEAVSESDSGSPLASIHASDAAAPEPPATPQEVAAAPAADLAPASSDDPMSALLASAPPAEPASVHQASPEPAAIPMAAATSGEPSDPLLGMTAGEIAPPRTLGGAMPRAQAPPPDRSFLMLVFLATYAATATAALLYLYLRVRGMGGSGQLESLPDLKPLKDNRVQFYRPGAVLPSQHSLALGQKVRFGNIEVEPIKVTRGPVHFRHFSGDNSKVRVPSADVLKLWVRLTNVSTDQSIAPLDDALLFTRNLTQDGEVVANNFVCRESDQAAGRSLVLLYDLPPASEWNLDGVAVDRVLAPGESIETCLPTTEEGWDALNGELVWRLHLRKGYGPAGNGVTTLVEVHFKSSDIESGDRA